MRERGEVFGVDGSIVIEIPLIPAAGLAEVVREGCEVFGVDYPVKVGVAEQGIGDFDGVGGQVGWIAGVGGVGVADAVTEAAEGVVQCDGAADDLRAGQVVVAVLYPCGDGGDGVGIRCRSS